MAGGECVELFRGAPRAASWRLQAAWADSIDDVRAAQRLRFAVFGAEMGGSKALIAGVSHFLPGGGAGPDASPPEKVYFVLDGELPINEVHARVLQHLSGVLK